MLSKIVAKNGIDNQNQKFSSKVFADHDTFFVRKLMDSKDLWVDT